jgi:hypothetical protein
VEVLVEYLADDEVCCVELYTVCRRYFVLAKSDKLQVEDKEILLSFLLSKPVVKVKKLKA